MDGVGGETEQWAIGLLKPWSGAKYVTLVTPLLLNTDSMGLLNGVFNAGFTLHSTAVQVNISKNNLRSSTLQKTWLMRKITLQFMVGSLKQLTLQRMHAALLHIPK